MFVSSEDLRIGNMETVADFEALQALHRLIWPEAEVDVLPIHLLVTLAHNGGLVLGAWQDEVLVGFLVGFLGTDEQDPDRVAMARLKHCSHILGVHPDCRDRSVGKHLKLAQREAMLRQGVRLITWTFDPLETRNANLNLAHLGGFVRQYKRDLYGEMLDGLNAGLPSDRFYVEWWITSNRVKQRIANTRKRLQMGNYEAAGVPLLNPFSVDENGFLVPPEGASVARSLLALIEVPTNFQFIKEKDKELAARWRMYVRATFEQSFAAGFIVTDFLYQAGETAQNPRSFYVLSQGEAQLGAESTSTSFSEN